MANDAGRVAILDGLVRAAGVPIDGISVSNITPTPPLVTIQYKASATAEQIATGEAILAGFDWRRRRALDRNTVVAGLQSLTVGQRNTLVTHMLAEYLRDNPAIAAQIGTFLGTPVAVDEVDPT